MKTVKQVPLFLLLEWIIHFKKENDPASFPSSSKGSKNPSPSTSDSVPPLSAVRSVLTIVRSRDAIQHKHASLANISEITQSNPTTRATRQIPVEPFSHTGSILGVSENAWRSRSNVRR